MSETLWELDAVRLGARLRGVSLSIRRGTTAVLGRSGAGKTSLLNLLVGFERPDGGKCTFTGDPGAGLYWVPGDWGLWPHVTARDHLARVCDDAPRAAALLDAFDLAHRAGAKPAALSAGERSRLAVARALATGARVLVMDEPLAHVEPSSISRYWDILQQHLQNSGGSLVFSTHAPAAALAHARRAVVLRDGELLAEGDARSLYDNPPGLAVAESFGPCNWFADGDAARWLGPAAPDGCYRPERIAVERAAPDDEPTAGVEWSRFGGAESEVALRRGDATRRVVHRGSAAFAPGDRVRLRVILSFLLAAVFFAVGCDETAQEKIIKPSAVKHWVIPPEGARAPAPRSICTAPGDELIVLDNAGRVLVYGLDGRIKRSWFMPEYSVGKPEGVCVLKDGRIAVGDTHYHRVVFFDREGKVVGMLGSFGKEPGQFIYPVAVTTDPQGHLYVAEYGSNDRVQKFRGDGTYVLSIGAFGPGPDQLQRPSGVVWRDGKILVADAINHRVQVYEDTGRYLGAFGAGSVGGATPATSSAAHGPELRFPYDLRFAPDGTLWVAEYGEGRLAHLAADGALLGRWGSPGPGENQLLTPWGVTVDAHGHVWVADTGNRRLVEVTP